jgi:CHASE2 domain-containing sensor protein
MNDEPPELIYKIDPIIEARLAALEFTVKPLDERATANTAEIQRLAGGIQASVSTRRNGRATRNFGAIAGLASMTYGCFLIAAWLPWLVIGTVLFCGSVAGMVSAIRNNNPRAS